MAAPLRFAAKRLCSGALERPQKAFLTAAKELAAPARSSRHGGASLRRRPFSSSTESSPAPELLNNNNEKSMVSLSKRARQKMDELQDLLRQMNSREALEFAKDVENERRLEILHAEIRRLPGSRMKLTETYWFKTIGMFLGIVRSLRWPSKMTGG